MIQYLDMTQAKGCFGVIPENGEVIVLTGCIRKFYASLCETEGRRGLR
jgi:hypothetical protein